ncbi:eIF-2-alpha kinase activator GCN1 [Cymbomonas tetramitiformis]|uniref:EIF-2-alpha kinase activator GCN1 n=1 Tax=Cymbomonas tetramitiformis TaxID=36881 RepID=A0AAE0FBA4_9CHLO|nr:eIF-2-alpha kinase activator GCN1 [Cymbomonas tetramitiformis]
MTALLPAVKLGLSDASEDVRETAGESFDILFRMAGADVTSDIVPQLLSELETDPYALAGLKEVLSKQPRILPTVLPKLAAAPMTSFRARALAALADVVKGALHAHLGVLLAALLPAMSVEDEEEMLAARSAAEAISLAVEEPGVHLLLGELQRGVADTDASVRAGAVALAGLFCKGTKLDVEEHTPGLLSMCIGLFVDNDERVVKAAWTATGEVTGTILKEDLPNFTKYVRQGINEVKDRAKRKLARGQPVLVPGLCLPKSLSPLLPIYLQGVLVGSSSEVRESAAEGIGELVEVTSEDSVKPFVVQITGPLIRVIGDKFPWQVKAAILQTLAIMIRKGGKSLKPFLPQLQTTFMKCLQDGAPTVRRRAAFALGLLMQLQPRVDPVVNDLLAGIASAEGGVRSAMVHALRGTLENAEGNRSPVMERVGATMGGLLSEEDEDMRVGAARTLGRYASLVEPAEVASVLQMVSKCPAMPDHRLANAMAMASMVNHAAEATCPDSANLDTIVASIKKHFTDDRAYIREAGLKASFLPSLSLSLVTSNDLVHPRTGLPTCRCVGSKLKG